jgi:hypothetical protein
MCQRYLLVTRSIQHLSNEALLLLFAVMSERNAVMSSMFEMSSVSPQSDESGIESPGESKEAASATT